MNGATRYGACCVQIAQEDIQRLVKGIGIDRVDTLPPENSLASAARRMVSTWCSDLGLPREWDLRRVRKTALASIGQRYGLRTPGSVIPDANRYRLPLRRLRVRVGFRSTGRREFGAWPGREHRCPGFRQPVLDTWGKERSVHRCKIDNPGA